MKKSHILLALAVASVQMAGARTLSPAEALARANRTPQEVAGTSRSGNVAPVMTVGEASAPAVYVFNQASSGYLILSADDVAAPVLGYSDSDVFDPQNIPDNLRWWLDEYKAQIAAAAKSGQAYKAPSRAAVRPEIAPLLKTLWDQSAPYNNLCPLKGSQRTVTGCVATAMAQVLKYHNWPDKASSNAKFSYQWTNTKVLSADYSNFTFDWKNMLDSYRNVSYTTAQANAVANLMKACGYSVEMNYNLSSAGGSGAMSEKVGGALVNYFKYDSGLSNEPRILYTSDEWESLIYDDLKASGPVLYAGNGSAGGHCFVCDGYRDGYFHFDWGWSGVSNGYFLLNALDPDELGIGGGTGGFNQFQMALIGVKPSTNGLTDPSYKFVCDGILSAKISDNDLKICGNFTNFSTVAVNGAIELHLKDLGGKTLKVFSMSVSEYDPGAYYPESILKTYQLGQGNGTYRIYPVFKMDDGKSYPFLCQKSQPGYIEITNQGGQWSVNVPGADDYSIVDQKVETGFYEDSEFFVTGSTHFTGSVESDVRVCGVLMTAPDASKIIGVGDDMTLSFVPGQDTKFDYLSYWFIDPDDYYGGAPDVTPGNDYYFAFAVEYGGYYEYKLISTPVKVKVNAKPSSVDFGLVSCTVENAAAVNPDDVVIKLDVKCTEGVLYDYFMVAIFNKNGANMGQFNTDANILTAGQTKTFVAHAKLDDVQPGEVYRVMPCYWDNGSWVKLLADSEMPRFTIGDQSGISDVIADGVESVEYFNLQGLRVDAENLTPGVYVVRKRMADGSVKTSKIIKK